LIIHGNCGEGKKKGYPRGDVSMWKLSIELETGVGAHPRCLEGMIKYELVREVYGKH
jgi:hypothetical protein